MLFQSAQHFPQYNNKLMTPDIVRRSELPSLFGIIQSEVTKFCTSLITLRQSTATNQTEVNDPF